MGPDRSPIFGSSAKIQDRFYHFMHTSKTPIISLTTDFGEVDGYVGIMRGVILNICPQATLTDLSHAIPPQDVQAAAFILYQSFDYYPAHTVHCVVVDPGVGSKRRGIAVRTDHGIFVGPDNGVFSLVLNTTQVNVQEAVTLTNPAYQLAEVSRTFHGRDVFAPAAAHIAKGTPLSRLGPPAINLVRLAVGEPAKKESCRVMHIDRFGNLILNITAKNIDHPDHVAFVCGGVVIKTVRQTFADVAEGELLAYVGSTKQHLELAVRNGSAAQKLGAKVGDLIKILED